MNKEKLEKIAFISGRSLDLFFVNLIICLYKTISEGKTPFIDINQISLDNNNLLLSNIEKFWINNIDYRNKFGKIFNENKIFINSFRIISITIRIIFFIIFSK